MARANDDGSRALPGVCIFLARVCKLLNVPRPPRGYWAKLAAGKPSAPQLLPAAVPGDPLEWSRDGTLIRSPKPQPPDPQQLRESATARARSRHPGTHRLITEARGHLETARELDDGFLRPAKQLLADIVVSKEALPHALSVADAVYRALEAAGHRVVITPHRERLRRSRAPARSTADVWSPNHWSPLCPTAVCVGTVAIGLTIHEISEPRDVVHQDGKLVLLSAAMKAGSVSASAWTMKRNWPSGQLTLKAYSPYPVADWSREWAEEAGKSMKSMTDSIVGTMPDAATVLARLVAEGERQAEVLRQEWERERKAWAEQTEQQRRAQAELESRKELLAGIDSWGAARRIEDLLADIQRSAAALPAEEHAALLLRLEKARQLLGSVDALQRLREWKAPDER